MSSDREVLRVEDLRVEYVTPDGPIKAVDGVSFTLQRRPADGVDWRVGLRQNDAWHGDRSLAAAAGARHQRADPGRWQRLLALGERELRQLRMRDMALIPQAAMNALNPVMRVGEQIADGILAHAHAAGIPQRDVPERVARALAQVGLRSDLASRYPHQLSGGQRQRAAMAIATALQPKIIVADEPTSALDVVVQRQVMQTLGRLQQGLHAAVLLIGHDMGLVAQFADTIGVLYAGRLVEQGPVDDILDAPRHPYTRLLIDSLPTLDAKKALRGIPGLPPSLLNLPPGCPFAPRCPYVFERCRVETPALQSVGLLQQAACHLYPAHTSLPPVPAAADTLEIVAPAPEAEVAVS